MSGSAPSRPQLGNGQAGARLRIRLLDQQLWCWGRDVLHPSGNLLVERGFSRTERPAGRSCASLYRLDHRPGARIIVRGFGVFIGEDRRGGIFISRRSARAQLTPSPDLKTPPWEPAELPPLRDPQTDRERDVCEELHSELCEWVAMYEQWVVARCGIAYRLRTADAWRQVAKRKCVPYASVAGAWRDWGRELLNGGVLLNEITDTHSANAIS